MNGYRGSFKRAHIIYLDLYSDLLTLGIQNEIYWMQEAKGNDDELVTLYTNSARKGVVRGFAKLRHFGFLIRQLVRINLQTEFKRSIIGMSWLFILPLFSVFIWVLLNSAGIVNPGDTSVPYPAYVLLSTSIWGFFADMYQHSSNMFVKSARLLVNTPFPYQAFVVELIIVHLIRFSIPFLLNLGVLFFFGVTLGWTALLFPLTLIPLLAAGLALGLLIAPLRIVAFDFTKLVDEGIRLLMFLTPVVYTPKLELGWLSSFVAFNPMTYLVSFSRDVLINGTWYEPATYALVCLLVTLALWLVMRLLTVGHHRILERLISG